MERADTQLLESQAWLPTPMLGGEPLRDDASIRDFKGGIGCHVASVVEEALLLPKICPSCGISGRTRSSLIVKDIWAWYDANPFFFFYL